MRWRPRFRRCWACRIAGARWAPRAGCTPWRRSRPSRSRGATSTSINERLRAPPRRVVLIAQLILAALVLYYIGRTLVAQWVKFRAEPLVANPRWSDIAGSGALVLATYAVLVQTWRVMLMAYGERLSFLTAA